MKYPILSVIVPVFNGADYLEKCLDSITGQTYKSLEIIIVNDGSTDATGEICLKYAKQDNRIIVVNQKNHGLTRTRKIAVGYATGEYVTFVDADDYIELDMYEKLLPYMQNVDLVTSGHYIDESCYYDMLAPGLYEGQEGMMSIYREMVYSSRYGGNALTGYLCMKIFKTKIVRRVFQEINENLKVYEDVDFLFRYMLSIESCYITRQCGYHYVMRPESLVHRKNKNYLSNLNEWYLTLEELFSKSQYKELLMRQLDKRMSILIKLSYTYMGLKYDEGVCYINPFMNRLPNKRIILFGAGVVGKSYMTLYKKHPDMNVVLWVDNNWKNLKEDGFQVESVHVILEMEYDYILVAVKGEKLYQEISSSLEDMGVDKDKILWEEPINTVEK